ncbi:MAG TPA: MFS transporter [Chthoniobacteraceae bacterium]|nr:MFS transporter [Chthoniobacteraceae bacterium]
MPSDVLPPPVPDHATTKLAHRSLWLLIAINLFCYLDRYILAAIIPELKAEFLADHPYPNTQAGYWTSAFLFSYMLTAPIFGYLADRHSRWMIIGISVAVWSVACGASGLAVGFVSLLITRVFLGIGEAGYGPAAPTLISDLYPVERRGRSLAWFYMAIPVGSALGFAFGGAMLLTSLGWRWAFFLVVIPGLLLSLFSFMMKEPPRTEASRKKPAKLADYKRLLKIPSLITNILAQTALTFAIGGLSVWAPTYIHEARGQPLAQTNMIFGGILVVGGLLATLAGGLLGDRLRSRFPGSYFLVSGTGMLLGFPATVAMLYTPFPYAWGYIFLAIFFLFLNVGPSNTAIANVTPPAIRASAFALNILVIHALGDAISPPLIGWVRDISNWNTAFLMVSTVMLVAGVIWLFSMKSLVRDTEIVTQLEADEALRNRHA